MASTKWFQAVKDGDLVYVTTHVQDLSCSINEHGETALMCAVRLRNIDLIRFLIEHESRCINLSGQSALIIAIREHFCDAVELLLPHEYCMGAIPGQLSPLDAAVDCGDNDILALVLKYRNKFVEKDCSTNCATLDHRVVMNHNMENNESPSRRSLPLSPDTFKTIGGTIGIPTCRAPPDSKDFELCKAAIWRLANKTIQSQDEFEGQFMAIQKRMENAILMYKQEIKILRRVLELAGIEGKTLQAYLKQARMSVDKQEKSPSPQSISIYDVIRFDSALTPPIITSDFDLRTSSDMKMMTARTTTATLAEEEKEGSPLGHKQDFVCDNKLKRQSNLHDICQEAKCSVEHTHSVDTASLYQHSRTQSSNISTFAASSQRVVQFGNDMQLQIAKNHQLSNTNTEASDSNGSHMVFTRNTAEKPAMTNMSHNIDYALNVFSGGGSHDDLELQLKLLSEDITILNNAIELFEEHDV